MAKSSIHTFTTVDPEDPTRIYVARIEHNSDGTWALREITYFRTEGAVHAPRD